MVMNSFPFKPKPNSLKEEKAVANGGYITSTQNSYFSHGVTRLLADSGSRMSIKFSNRKVNAASS